MMRRMIFYVDGKLLYDSNFQKYLEIETTENRELDRPRWVDIPDRPTTIVSETLTVKVTTHESPQA